MKLRLETRLETRLRLYLVALHLVLAAALFGALRERPWLLLVAELAFALSLVLGWRLVSALFVPLRLIETGADLIDERDFTSTFVPVGQPEMDRLIEVYNRMIAALREEKARGREQEDFLARLIEASPAGIVICDLDGAVTQLNPAARRLLGDLPRDRPGRVELLEDLPPPWGRSLPALESGEGAVLTLGDGRRVRCRAAELRDRGFRRRFLVLEELTEELRRTEKAAYEKLIRMMTHEVNNSVGAVTSLLGALGHYAGQVEDEDRQDFENALDVAGGRLERLRAFVDAFASVVRLPEPNRRPTDLDALLDELLTLYAPSLAERKIRVERHREDELPPISADRQQLEQALLNVLKNAAEAIEESGTITVTTRLEKGRPTLHVDDDGPGLDATIATELFAPFYTTKPEGCGLGLTLLQEIMTRHDFTFGLEPRQAGGCRFTVRF